MPGEALVNSLVGGRTAAHPLARELAPPHPTPELGYSEIRGGRSERGCGLFRAAEEVGLQ